MNFEIANCHMERWKKYFLKRKFEKKLIISVVNLKVDRQDISLMTKIANPSLSFKQKFMAFIKQLWKNLRISSRGCIKNYKFHQPVTKRWKKKKL